MKTTLILPDPLMVALKRRAAERGTSLSALAAELLRRGLDEQPRAPYEPNFPVFHGTGPALVDLSDWNAVQDTLNAERDARFYPWLRADADDPGAPPER